MANATQTETDRVREGSEAIDETYRLIASNKVEGTSVFSPDGQNIGSIHNFMVDKLSGKVSYAVMSFGGFLGIGEQYHPLPWDTLSYSEDLGGYMVNVTREQLEEAPRYGRHDDPWTDPEYGRRVYSYYGLPFYI
ncbi:MAG: PRC-barrel domain-containing protein [Paracoccaceae bacterium]|nr:PRC-barrel domain-containing protein [Paracoccaceae bacterium]